MKRLWFVAAILFFFGVSILRGEEGDDSREDHAALSEAGRWAVLKGNVDLLKALLEAGLEKDGSLDEWDNRLLHVAAYAEKPLVVKFLIERGATVDLKNKHDDRPIDMAFREKKTQICELLKKPEKPGNVIAGYPEEVLGMLLKTDEEPDAEPRVRYVSVNGEDPGKELMTYLKGIWKDAKPASEKTEEKALLIEISLKKPEGTDYEWRIRKSTGPFLSGGGEYGRMLRRYGYWIRQDDGSWDE